MNVFIIFLRVMAAPLLMQTFPSDDYSNLMVQAADFISLPVALLGMLFVLHGIILIFQERPKEGVENAMIGAALLVLVLALTVIPIAFRLLG